MLKTESPQPANRKGGKAIDCPFYADCLMHAAKRNWKAWTCEECPNLELHLLSQKLRFIAPYYQAGCKAESLRYVRGEKEHLHALGE
jgi:hypothetical protein